MRSRPTIEVVYTPRLPRAEDKVRFEVRLFSRTRTPVNAVHVHFIGRESRMHQTQGKTILTADHTHVVADFTTDPLVLEAGSRLALPFEVKLPKGIPPTFRSPASTIEYRLETRVDIPWWPDGWGSFILRVAPSRPGPEQIAEAFVANSARGPRGKELQLELRLDRTALTLGGELGGALSIENVEHHAVRRVELAVVVVDAPVGKSQYGAIEIHRSTPIVLVPGVPAAGVAYPFVLRLPAHIVPSFTGKRVRVRWYLEARAVIRYGRDVVLRSSLSVCVGRDEKAPAARAPAEAGAPMGRERRAMVWAEVAERTGLRSQSEAERMTGQEGQVALALHLELRGEQLYSVATLAWPALGLDVDVADRRWTDAFRDGAQLGDEEFDRRLTARGREPSQVRALLRPDVRAALLTFERIALDDEGAVLASPGNGYTVAELEAFVREALAAARVLSQAVHRLPAPMGLEPHREAWAAFAQTVGGRFEPGGFAIRGARYKDASVELVTRFDEAGAPVASVARVLTRAPEVLTPQAERALASLRKECTGLAVAPDAVEATLPCPLAEPARAESLWRGLLRVAKELATA